MESETTTMREEEKEEEQEERIEKLQRLLGQCQDVTIRQKLAKESKEQSAELCRLFKKYSEKRVKETAETTKYAFKFGRSQGEERISILREWTESRTTNR
jgi:hypothetical protein